MELRDRIEIAFETWGRLLIRFHWLAIGLMLVLTAGLSIGFSTLTIEASVESFLKKGDHERVAYNEFRAEFESDQNAILLIESDDVFSLTFLEKLRRLHEELEESLPYVDDLDSLINARVTIGMEDELVVRDLFEEWPETPEQLAEIKALATENPLYQNVLLSPNLRFTRITALLSSAEEQHGDVLSGFDDEEDASENSADGSQLIKGYERDEFVEIMMPIVERYRSDDFIIHVGGGQAVAYSIVNGMQTDMVKFTALSLLTIALLLYFLFRRLSAVFLSIVVVSLPLVSTFGFMGLAGLPVYPPVQILPSFLIAVGVGGAVHLLSIFFRRYDAGDTKEDALVFSLGHSGLPIVMTSMTTAGGLFSFSFADLQAISALGTCSPIGVMLALLYTLVLMPALITALPIRHKQVEAAQGPNRLDRFLSTMGTFSTRNPFKVIVAWTLLLVVSGAFAAQLRFSHHILEWLSPKDETRLSSELLNDEFSAGLSMEVVFDTKQENGIQDPEFLRKLEAMQRYGAQLELNGVAVGKAVSVIDILKETHQALNENDPEFYVVPEERALIAQELLLFENGGADDLARVTDSQLQKSRLTLLIPNTDALLYGPMIDDLRKTYTRMLDGSAEVHITGIAMLMSRTTDALLTSMGKSYMVAMLIITPMMILLIGHVRRGFLSMIPNLAPIIIGLGLMQVIDLNLDMFTILIGSITIGVAVDDTIHFMHNFRRYHDRHGDVERAVQETLLSTGSALLVTSIVLACGFSIFMAATMANLRGFGLITSITVAVAFLADVVLAPALVTVACRYWDRDPTEVASNNSPEESPS